jgi:hypothetical protein
VNVGEGANEAAKREIGARELDDKPPEGGGAPVVTTSEGVGEDIGGEGWNVRTRGVGDKGSEAERGSGSVRDPKSTGTVAGIRRPEKGGRSWAGRVAEE